MKLLALVTFLACAYGNVIGIDFGSEFYKISLIGPGKKLVIVENDHTKRKTPTAVFFSQSERQFGMDAINSGIRTPKSSLSFVNRLLGVPYNNTEQIQRYKDEFLAYDIEEDPERHTINIKVGDQLFQSEEVTAMILESAKDMAERFANGHAKDCVITVPSFYNRAQRISLLVAAQAAGLKVLSLMNENTGAAIYYGVDRFDNDTSHLAVFYNLGASSLQVTLAKYDTLMSSAGKLVENIEVLAHAGDEFLGGRTIDAAFAQYVIDEYQKTKGVDLRESPRAISKLMQTVNRLKQTLSANRVANLNIESIYQGNDLSMVIEREVFEKCWEHLHERLVAPIRDVLAQYGVSKSDIHSLEIIGGLIRIPKIQELLKQFMEVEELGWHLNGDEAMANGAVFFAANYSATVQVRPVLLSEFSQTDVVVKFAGPEKETTVFPRGTRLGSKKRISLSYADDLVATLYYNRSGELDPIMSYNVTKIKEVSEKYDTEPVNYFIFLMDLSGISGLIEAESRFNATVEEIRKKKKTSLKLEEVETEPAEEEVAEEAEAGHGDGEIHEEDITDGLPDEDVVPVEEEPPVAEDEATATEEQEGEAPPTEEQEGGAASDEADATKEEGDGEAPSEETAEATEEKEEEPEKPKLKDDEEIVFVNKTLSVQLSLSSEELEFPRTINKSEMTKILENLRELSKEDENRRKNAEARNNLESYIYFVKNKLEDDTFIMVTNETDVENIRQLASDALDWFEYESDGVDRSEVSAKHKELKDAVKAPLERELEMEKREGSVKRAFKKLEELNEKWESLNKTKTFVPLKEREEVWNYINESVYWLTEKVAEQEALPLTEEPVLTSKKIENKISRAEKKIDRLERKKETEDKDKKKKAKKEKDTDIPPEFIFGEDMDWSNIKMDNVKFGDKTFSNVNKDGADGDGEAGGEEPQEPTGEEGEEEKPAENSEEAGTDSEQEKNSDEAETEQEPQDSQQFS